MKPFHSWMPVMFSYVTSSWAIWKVAESNFERIYMDFGAPESEQIPALIQRDIPFKEFCDELGFEVAFNIIIGGGGAYKASVDYLQKLVSVVDSKFETVV